MAPPMHGGGDGTPGNPAGGGTINANPDDNHGNDGLGGWKPGDEW